MRNRAPLGPYRRTMPGALWQSYGGGQFLMSEVLLYQELGFRFSEIRGVTSSGDEGEWGRDWYSIAQQPAPAPHLARPEARAALRIVLMTVPRVSRSCEHFPEGFDPHLLPRQVTQNLSTAYKCLGQVLWVSQPGRPAQETASRCRVDRV